MAGRAHPNQGFKMVGGVRLDTKRQIEGVNQVASGPERYLAEVVKIVIDGLSLISLSS